MVGVRENDLKALSIDTYKTEIWLTPEELSREKYSDYWNSEDIEKQKTLERDPVMIRELQQNFRSLQGIGADLGCGNMWTIPYVTAWNAVDKVYCVEYSYYRLFERGRQFLEQHFIPREKVVLCLGSFYRLWLPNEFLDFVILAGSFHHAHKPELLLREIKRVLKPEGRLLVIGEHSISWKERLTVLKQGRNPFKRQVLIDSRLGDYGYSKRTYKRMFTDAGFQRTGKETFTR